jgi:hypothetical protein
LTPSYCPLVELCPDRLHDISERGMRIDLNGLDDQLQDSTLTAPLLSSCTMDSLYFASGSMRAAFQCCAADAAIALVQIDRE